MVVRNYMKEIKTNTQINGITIESVLLMGVLLSQKCDHERQWVPDENKENSYSKRRIPCKEKYFNLQAHQYTNQKILSKMICLEYSVVSK